VPSERWSIEEQSYSIATLVYKVTDTPEEDGNWSNRSLLKMARKDNLKPDNVPIISAEHTLTATQLFEQPTNNPTKIS
jgi:hypothetical protein